MPSPAEHSKGPQRQAPTVVAQAVCDQGCELTGQHKDQGARCPGANGADWCGESLQQRQAEGRCLAGGGPGEVKAVTALRELWEWARPGSATGPLTPPRPAPRAGPERAGERKRASLSLVLRVLRRAVAGYAGWGCRCGRCPALPSDRPGMGRKAHRNGGCADAARRRASRSTTVRLAEAGRISPKAAPCARSPAGRPP